QVTKHSVLGRRELDAFVVAPYRVGLVVEHEVAHRQLRHPSRRAAAAAEHRFDPRDDLLEPERLGDVVVTAEPQPAHLVLGGVTGGEEDDRYLHAVVAQPTTHLKAVAAWHRDVEQHDVRTYVDDLADRVETVPSDRHVEAEKPEAGGQHVGDVI